MAAQSRRFLFSPPQKLVHAAPEDFRELDKVRGLREAFAAFPFRHGGALHADALGELRLAHAALFSIRFDFFHPASVGTKQ